MNKKQIPQFSLIVFSIFFTQWSHADTFTYDTLNRLTSVTFTNGATQSYSYDAAGNMVGMGSTGQTVLNSQTISPGAVPVVVVGGTGTVSASASSGLGVTFSTTTAGVCTVQGATVTGVAVGLCTVAADQAGNASYSAAPRVLMSFNVATGLSAPSAPTITSIVPGPGRVTLSVLAPSSNGGGAIVGYTATCTSGSLPTRTVTGTGPALVVAGLTAGVSYNCTVTASNGSYSSSASAAQTAVAARKKDLSSIIMLLMDESEYPAPADLP